ncbi:MAG: hypothetical protein ACRC33_21870 [Gemmataceae bacterium]
MKIYRSHAPQTAEAVALLSAAARPRAHRPPGPDGFGVARCPRCGFEVVARMSRHRPVLWCRCAARLPRPAA